MSSFINETKRLKTGICLPLVSLGHYSLSVNVGEYLKKRKVKRETAECLSQVDRSAVEQGAGTWEGLGGEL